MRHLPPGGAFATALAVGSLLAIAAASTPAGAQDRPFGRGVRPAPYERPTTKAERVRQARATRATRSAAMARQRADAAVVAHESVGEVEPNDTTTSANPAAIGDVLNGVIAVPGDEDFFAFDVPAGARVEFDLDANVIGSQFDPILGLFAADGRSLIAFNDDDGSSLDSRIIHSFAQAGRYFIAVAALGGTSGSPTYRYTVRIATLPTGPGDGTTLLANGLGTPYAIAAAPGAIWVLDQQDTPGARLLRVTNSGIVTTVVQGSALGLPFGIAVDGFGDVLVAGGDGEGRGQVLRVTPTGQVSTFRRDVGYSVGIAVGPDGDVWVVDDSSQSLRRFDPTGVPKGSTSTASAGFVRLLAFSPAGDLHFTNGFDAVYRLTAGTPVRVLTRPEYLEGLAFDAAGRLYVANGFRGTVSLFSATYQPIAEPFASSNLGGPTALAFLRDASGAMSSRLVASNVGFGLQAPYVGSLVEMRAGSVTNPGFRVGTDLLQVANAELRPALVGAELRDTLRLVSGASATWTITDGTLPPGITLTAANGVLSGIPERKGSFDVSVRAVTSSSLGARRFTLVVDEPSLEIGAATDHLLGATGALTPALARYLDLQGNKNGRADIGDLRAYLRTRGMLPMSAATGTTTARTGGTTP